MIRASSNVVMPAASAFDANVRAEVVQPRRLRDPRRLDRGHPDRGCGSCAGRTGRPVMLANRYIESIRAGTVVECGERSRGQRHLAPRSGRLRSAHLHDPAFPVDVTALEVRPLRRPQSRRCGEPDRGTVAGVELRHERVELGRGVDADAARGRLGGVPAGELRRVPRQVAPPDAWRQRGALLTGATGSAFVGLPAIGRGVSGATNGSDPLRALLNKEHRSARRR